MDSNKVKRRTGENLKTKIGKKKDLSATGIDLVKVPSTPDLIDKSAKVKPDREFRAEGSGEDVEFPEHEFISEFEPKVAPTPVAAEPQRRIRGLASKPSLAAGTKPQDRGSPKSIPRRFAATATIKKQPESPTQGQGSPKRLTTTANLGAKVESQAATGREEIGSPKRAFTMKTSGSPRRGLSGSPKRDSPIAKQTEERKLSQSPIRRKGTIGNAADMIRQGTNKRPTLKQLREGQSGRAEEKKGTTGNATKSNLYSFM
jgi:hypothetical protein